MGRRDSAQRVLWHDTGGLLSSLQHFLHLVSMLPHNGLGLMWRRKKATYDEAGVTTVVRV
jgi:hypothetical protein